MRARLDAALSGLEADLALIRDLGRFSAGGGGWSLWSEEGTVTGEGPSGFRIRVYPAVVELTSLERFGAVERPDQGIHTAIRRVFEAMAAAFGGGGRLAVASGGYGDTDRAPTWRWPGPGSPRCAAAWRRPRPARPGAGQSWRRVRAAGT